MSPEKRSPVVALILLLTVAIAAEPVFKKVLATEPVLAQSSPAVTPTPSVLTPDAPATPTASPEATATPETKLVPASEPTAGTPTGRGTTQEALIPLFLLGTLAFLLFLLFWYKKRRATVAPTDTPEPSVTPASSTSTMPSAEGMAIAPSPVVPAPTPQASITLTPRDAHQAYAQWDVSDVRKAEVQAQGGENLMLRLYDVTGLNPNTATPTNFEEFDVVDTAWDRNLPIPDYDRDYVAEVGYLANDGRWLPIARSNAIRVAPPNLVDVVVPMVGGAVAAVAAGAAALASSASEADSAIPEPVSASAQTTITLTTRDAYQAYAYWDAPDTHKAAVQAQGGENLMLRLYDVTGLDPETTSPRTVEQFDVVDTAWDRNVPIPAYDRDYVVEVGYLTGDGRWLPMARSNAIRVVPPNLVDMAVHDAENVGEVVAAGAIAAGAIVAGAVAAGAAALSAKDSDPQSNVEAAKFDVGQTDLSSEALASVDADLPELPAGYGESRIVLMPRDPQWAYAYWDTPNDHKEAVRRQGGERLALRIYDVTDIDINHQSPHNLQQYDCDEMARDWYVPMPVSDRDYIAEIGYVTFDGHWLILARSSPCHIPPVYPSDWEDDQFLTISWDEDLRGKTFATLIPSDRKVTTGNPIYNQLFGMAQSAEAMRVAGSMFGSMQHVAGSIFGSHQMAGETALSSYLFASGAGMATAPGREQWSVPTMSGLTSAGLTMSGAGLGFSASMPPLRSRKFWLVADAELIIYGATEPDAKVTIAGRPVTLNPDGTFRFQMSFQDGNLDFPILAVASDGEQNRSIHMTFNRETLERRTNRKEDAIDEEY